MGLFHSCKSKYGFEYEQHKPVHFHKNANILIGDADLKIQKDVHNQFDLIISTQVLEHVPVPFAVVSMMNKILSPKGVLIFSVPFMTPFHHSPGDFWRFTWMNVVTLLRTHGFKVCSIAGDGPRSVVADMLSMYLPTEYLMTESNSAPGRLWKFPMNSTGGERLTGVDSNTYMALAVKDGNSCAAVPRLVNEMPAEHYLNPKRWGFNPFPDDVRPPLKSPRSHPTAAEEKMDKLQDLRSMRKQLATLASKVDALTDKLLPRRSR